MSTPGLPDPWHGPTPRALEAEFRREIGRGHPLAKRRPRAIAACTGCDDVLFALDDETWAIVHLTWSGKSEKPPWPHTTQLGSFFAVDLATSQHTH